MADASLQPIGALPAATGALALDTYQLTKRFGSFTAMDSVTMRVEPGTVHALLGENGAGKSTLVKCVAGYQRAEEGSILIDGREQEIANPVVARALGIGMVYQHFTLAPGMTVAENLLLEDCCGATDRGNHEAAVKMVKMQGGVFGAVARSTDLLRVLP